MKRLPLDPFDFRRIPYDVLQWELNRFLKFTDRTAFNTVVDPPERIYRRLPKNFAVNHSINVALNERHRHMTHINFWMPRTQMPGFPVRALRAISRYVTFLCSPTAVLIFKFSSDAKKHTLTQLNNFLIHNNKILEIMTSEIRESIISAIHRITVL